ncbi:MAG: transcriptional repressor LexA [Lautropia sp.]|nr:transcriptional repressor LexA [Lautropia sp.]
MRPLTARQRDVLFQIKTHLEQTGFPPTRAEIASALGFRSVNAAEDHLKALARKGMIELCAGTSRGIRLLPAADDSRHPPDAADGVSASAPLRAVLQTGLVSQGHEHHCQSGGSRSRGGTSPEQHLCLPLVGRVAAGHPILAEKHIETSFLLDASLFERRPDYLLRIRGTSMRDAGMLDGDLLAVRATTDAYSGQIVVARLGHEVTVKRLHCPGPGLAITLLPENPAFDPIVIAPDTPDFHIEGIGVGLIRQRPVRH